ncbi:adenylyltransferase/cytidyltransferase family protein [bacterium]|nr:adenylyltransferase/cytidyltransferase family protein [bacterium]
MQRNNKIKALAELAEVLAPLRVEGKKIIHCHGVFDLLHIGHIRYLQKAKNLGDVLIVTVTPDHYVNKGPHRPAFPEKLRVEAIAALDCVDYVAINEWPTAVETIELLKPDIYAKGAEYRERRTPEIIREEAAVASVGAEIAFIEDITSSSSHLINKYLSPFPEEVDNYLIKLSQSYSPVEILRYIEQAHSLRVLVVGETIIDEYYYCHSMSESSKAPILAMQYLSHERFAGGAVAIATHFAGFCSEVGLVSMLGTENSEEEWIKKNLKKNVNAFFLHKTDSSTIVKRRYRESYFNLPVFEIYTMNDTPLTNSDNKKLCAQLQKMLLQYDIVVVADYGHTMLTEQAIHILCEDTRFLSVNTQANAGNRGYHTISKYPRADYVCLAEQELRLECRSRSGDIHPMLQEVAHKLGAARAVVTQGGHGCLCYNKETGFCEAPALATRVVDRVGAGDAFLAITSLCAVQKAPMEILAFLGNLAGAEAVATVGHRESLERLSLRRHVESLLK